MVPTYHPVVVPTKVELNPLEGTVLFAHRLQALPEASVVDFHVLTSSQASHKSCYHWCPRAQYFSRLRSGAGGWGGGGGGGAGWGGVKPMAQNVFCFFPFRLPHGLASFTPLSLNQVNPPQTMSSLFLENLWVTQSWARQKDCERRAPPEATLALRGCI